MHLRIGIVQNVPLNIAKSRYNQSHIREFISLVFKGERKLSSASIKNNILFSSIKNCYWKISAYMQIYCIRISQ